MCFREKHENTNLRKYFGKYNLLEEESCVQVECETAILLVEALCSFKCNDEVLFNQ